jgi:hypothetical protein
MAGGCRLGLHAVGGERRPRNEQAGAVWGWLGLLVLVGGHQVRYEEAPIDAPCGVTASTSRMRAPPASSVPKKPITRLTGLGSP